MLPQLHRKPRRNIILVPHKLRRMDSDACLHEQQVLVALGSQLEDVLFARDIINVLDSEAEDLLLEGEDEGSHICGRHALLHFNSG